MLPRSPDDHELARELASEAGELLLDLRARRGFADPAALRGAGDWAAHELLTARLRDARPGDAVLSEHGCAGPDRAAAPRVWIIDPLDGTREFGEQGRDDWAVHVALVEVGQLTVGAVAMPARASVLSTGSPPAPGVLGSGPVARPVGSTAPARLRIAVSRTRPPELASRLAAELDAQTVPMGSAGVKIAAVLLGDVDIYVHAGGQYEWDSAAPVAVARAAGMHTSRVDGSELSYNQPGEPWLPDLLVCRRELAGPALGVLAGARAQARVGATESAPG